jgi:hypothetical protein
MVTLKAGRRRIARLGREETNMLEGLTKGQVEAKIAALATTFQREQMGRGPHPQAAPLRQCKPTTGWTVLTDRRSCAKLLADETE